MEGPFRSQGDTFDYPFQGVAVAEEVMERFQRDVE
jgi:hypothetical protein